MSNIIQLPCCFKHRGARILLADYYPGQSYADALRDYLNDDSSHHPKRRLLKRTHSPTVKGSAAEHQHSHCWKDLSKRKHQYYHQT